METCQPQYISDLNWSETILVLGEGVQNWSQKYKNLTFCIAGIGEISGWIRLYPIAGNLYSEIEVFDLIQAVIRDYNPEPHRPESRKVVYGKEFIRVIGRVDKDRQGEILIEHTDSGEFLHGDGWRYRSLGMIKPKKVRIKEIDGEIYIRYKCDYEGCNGHTSKAFPFLKFDKVGRRRMNDEIIKRVENSNEDDLRFVVGTVASHPQKWILIHIHSLDL